MFTGIISHRGTIVSRSSTSLTFSIPSTASGPSNPLDDLKAGSSIAVNGVCLTVAQLHEDKIRVDIMPETWRKTALATLHKNDFINLELPMQIGARFEGHIVQGHADGVARLKSLTKDGNSLIVTYHSDRNITRLMVPKGSVAVDGISLTLISVKDGMFSVGIIPYTFTHTNMELVAVGKKVNIEIDVIAKYVERLLYFQQGGIYEKH